jgi:glycosyltransferase involved in cell wall biosynthesis
VTVGTESPYNDKDSEDLASVSTVFGVNDLASVDRMAAVTARKGGAALYLPTAWTRGVHEPAPPSAERVSDVFFCGTGFDERGDLFSAVDWEALGVRFRLAGFWPGSDQEVVTPSPEERRLGQVPIGHWPGLKKYMAAGLVDNRELPGWYASAKIVLSVHRSYRPEDEDDGVAQALSVGPRVYEAAACGAFQLCDDSRPELAEIFGESVPTYEAGNADDLAAKVLFYLGQPELRREMALEAMERVARHSYDDRLTKLVTFISAAPG